MALLQKVLNGEQDRRKALLEHLFAVESPNIYIRCTGERQIVMTDYTRKIKSMYEPNNRYANFGAVLRSINIHGFRGIADLTVEFEFPVTVIAGLNGAGKSTVSQISLSAYKKPSTATKYKRFYIRDFFPKSVVDPTPFIDDAFVKFRYETDNPEKPQELTVSRKKSEWSGYKRQPERQCFYVGFTMYIPKVERKDVSIYRGKSIELSARRNVSEETRSIVQKILGQPYDNLYFQDVHHRQRHAELGIAVRGGQRYSENNMGFGEGRVLYLVDLLETAPEQSLFVVEEPETALHEYAQYEIAKYFLEVCSRRHHQIILTTHSMQVIDALPNEARLFLARGDTGVSVQSGLGLPRIRAILSAGYKRDFLVFVEDEFAKALLQEIIRKVDKELLDAIDIKPVGNTDDVKKAVYFTRTTLGKACAGVLDGDMNPDSTSNIFTLPGNEAPEKEVYMNDSVKRFLKSEFNVDMEKVKITRNIQDHHQLTKYLAEKANSDPGYLQISSIRHYLDSIGIDSYREIVEKIQKLLAEK